uniref:Uncharacterized protein n=1 Tax=Oryzias latipes TaxID=8090 RepID=A0A286P9X2_ORYLA|nr:hypothetical protein [Oryzias latipes]
MDPPKFEDKEETIRSMLSTRFGSYRVVFKQAACDVWVRGRDCTVQYQVRKRPDGAGWYAYSKSESRILGESAEDVIKLCVKDTISEQDEREDEVVGKEDNEDENEASRHDYEVIRKLLEREKDSRPQGETIPDVGDYRRAGGWLNSGRRCEDGDRSTEDDESGDERDRLRESFGNLRLGATDRVKVQHRHAARPVSPSLANWDLDPSERRWPGFPPPVRRDLKPVERLFARGIRSIYCGDEEVTDSKGPSEYDSEEDGYAWGCRDNKS